MVPDRNMRKRNTKLYRGIATIEATRATYILSVWGGQNYFFSVFIFYARFGMLLKGMGESFLLSEDEPLTPNIDGLMAL